MSRVLLTGFLLLLISGCSINPKISVHELTQQPASRLDIPFYAQEEFQCGPAALAGVLNAAQVSIGVESLVDMVYLPDRQGSLQLELLSATRRLGRIAYVLEPDPAAVFAEISSGRPVLILQNLGTRGVPVWHYAVVTGFDPVDNAIWLNSGVTRHLKTPAEKWLRTWDWGERWAMVALEPGETPASDDFRGYAEAVSAFEKTAEAEARQIAWNAAIERWPAEPAAYLALGNLAYESGERDRAKELFQTGLTLDALDPALSNNLASVLAETGCTEQAVRIIRRSQDALDSESPWLPILGKTLEEIQAAPPSDEANCG